MQFKEIYRNHKKKIIWGVAILFLILVFKPSNKESKVETQTVERADLRQEVSLTGTVESRNIASLAFEGSGKVQKIHVAENQQVKKGEKLISLNADTYFARRSQNFARYEVEKLREKEAERLLDAEKAKLEDLKGGAKPSAVRLAEEQLKSTIQKEERAGTEVERQIEQNDTEFKNQVSKNFASLKLINSKVYQGILDLTDIQYENFYGSSNESTQISIKKAKFMRLFFNTDNAERYSNLVITGLNSGLYNEIINFNNSEDESKVIALTSKLKDAASSLVDAYSAIAYTTSIDSTEKTLINTNLQSLNTDFATLVSNQVTLSSLERTNDSLLATKKIAFENATLTRVESEASLENVKSGASSSAIYAQEQLIAQKEIALESQKASSRAAYAAVADINSEINKRIITAPFDGLITKIDIDEGEIAFSNTEVAELISEGNFEITANIPESDIAKIKIGDTASFDLDALSSDLIFEAEVVKISESANLIEGVPVYEVLLQITSDTNLVKSGMTANIDILTDKRENVLFIPSRAVTDSKVKILLENGMIEQRDIKTGLKSFDAKIEVTSGLEEGEKVITYMEEENE
ncbi:efflux RND transporter periplasmic adaptor subunit [bacterium]|jgi:RND family efflux transporter MFP subunit|nr:efflux RND transporter periplasmic adaptor subunit [bacterium]MBT6293207.1 efflux RND transporter periplasmic adaptor subunit [bacterium]